MGRRITKRSWLSMAVLVVGSASSWAIYGPSIERADVAVAVRACQEAKFTRGAEVANAMKSGEPAQVLRVLGDALKEWKATPATSALYAARAFCVHELVPNRLSPTTADLAAERLPTPEVKRFHGLGIEYTYYGPDGEFIPAKDPVDLIQLATQHQDSRWGREAFLMMTRLGWSEGACQEGPDQFREVIQHGEQFLKKYPSSEVSDSVRLELANAYATWWNQSLSDPNPPYPGPEPYKAGAEHAKQRAIALYQQYLRAQKTPAVKVQKRLKALQESPKGSETFDYFCEDYED